MQKHSEQSFESKPLLDFLTKQALLLQSPQRSCPNLHHEDQKVSWTKREREGEREHEIPISCHPSSSILQSKEMENNDSI